MKAMLRDQLQHDDSQPLVTDHLEEFYNSQLLQVCGAVFGVGRLYPRCVLNV